jgi:flagellar basal-body rod protein FlgB
MQTRLDREVGFYEQGLKVRSQRQQVLATNIANADTPNYKAQDINFRTAMQSALSSDNKNAKSPSGGLAVTQANHIGTSAPSSALVQARQQLQNSADGNTVDMDVEQSQFAENALQYETLVQMISGKFKKLNSVLQG